MDSRQCRIRCLGGLLIATAMLGCAPDRDAETAAVDGALIGGERADVGEFPSTVVVAYEYPFPDGTTMRFPLCTAAKVGPRHLLIAAHCMLAADEFSNTIGLSWVVQPGARILITNRPEVDFATTELTPVTVAEAHVFPEFLAACEQDPMTCNRVGGVSDGMPDVGVIVVEEELAGIPTARVDLRPVLVGEPLAIQGYGCRDSIHTQETYAQIELKHARTFAMPADGAAYRDVFRSLTPAQYREQIAPSIVMTPGPVVAEDQGGLCPGDSGGPLYRRQGRNDVVVGVNASYGFIIDETGQDIVPVPLTNWHTRLDALSRYRVSNWLIERGARVTFSPLLDLHLDVAQCADGFEARYVGLGGLYCVDPRTGLVDARMITLDMLAGCWERAAAAGEGGQRCYEPLWDEAEYLALRGDGFCAIGATFDVRLGACVNGLFTGAGVSDDVRAACAELGTPCESPDEPMTTIHRALTTAPVRPIIECVRRQRDGSYVASFGYESEARRAVHIVPGADNTFGAVVDRGQVADFFPGRVRNAFSVRFGASESASWTLTSPDGTVATATASASSPRCR